MIFIKQCIFFSTVESTDKNKALSKVTTDPDLQKFRKLDNDSRPGPGHTRRSSLDLADLNYMSKEVTAAKEVSIFIYYLCSLIAIYQFMKEYRKIVFACKTNTIFLNFIEIFTFFRNNV